MLKTDGFGVRPYLQDNPVPPLLQIAGVREIDYDIQFQGPAGYQAVGDKLTVIVEACIARNVDIGSQKLLDRLHGDASLKAAIEADPRLTSRLADDGTITISQAPAADALRVTRYVGQTRHTIGGVEYLLAEWEVEVLT